jgi:hypothetical protein
MVNRVATDVEYDPDEEYATHIERQLSRRAPLCRCGHALIDHDARLIVQCQREHAEDEICTGYRPE